MYKMKRKYYKTYKRGLNLFNFSKSRLINLVKKLTQKITYKKKYRMRGG